MPWLVLQHRSWNDFCWKETIFFNSNCQSEGFAQQFWSILKNFFSYHFSIWNTLYRFFLHSFDQLAKKFCHVNKSTTVTVFLIIFSGGVFDHPWETVYENFSRMLQCKKKIILQVLPRVAALIPGRNFSLNFSMITADRRQKNRETAGNS